MSVIDHRPASAFVVAGSPTCLLAMDEEILWSLVRSSHAAACNLLIGLTARLRHADAVIAGDPAATQDYRCYGTVDALTGLHNRFWLEGMLERRVERVSKGDQPCQLAMIMIDIDDFKTFNERFGHTYGDHVLFFVSHAICDHLRPAEIIARYGGDEFAVLISDIDVGMAQEICERIHQGVMAAVPVMPDGKSIPHPTISLSLTMWQPGQTAAQMLAEAEKALAGAKNSGRGCLPE
jgi:diguanylate cyclase (GGDEF)-like protein